MKKILYRFIILICSFLLFGFSSCRSKEMINEKPNIIVIMADDLGYSDIGCFGGEIETPHLDALADNGVRFTQFYNAARCCPTRASLLTGKYPHQVGLAKNGRTLSRNAATIAEVLQQNGYHTGMAGKWHLSQTKKLEDDEEQLLWLSHRKDSAVFAPLESYPCNRGFEEHWGVIWGVVNFFDPFSLVHNEKEIETVPENFYFTDFITDKSIEMIEQFNKDENPFFLYIAHTAPHWPLHALPEDIEKYQGMYDEGWDVLRTRRYQRAIDLGIIEPTTAKLGPNESGKNWNDCKEKAWEAKHMEAHAAMINRLDQGVGKVIDKLKSTGNFENTVIIFLSDNGASPERGYKPGFDRPGHTRKGEEIIYPHQRYERPGPEKTWGYLGSGWAGAVNSPFRYWKKESFEGGSCTPFFIHWPGGLSAEENSINREVAHVMDIFPTCLELSGSDYPTQINGLQTTPIEGKSLLPVIFNITKTRHDSLFWEHEGGRAARVGNWKISALKNHPWELFDLQNDRTETNNLAKYHPEKVSELEKLWDKWYNGVHSQISKIN